jgi:hypothetical protein
VAIPFRRPPKDSVESLCAYLAIVAPSDATLQAGLLVTAGSGIPLEFVYNSIQTPSGLLWPASEVRKAAALALAHSLFDACVQNPILLLSPSSFSESGLDPASFAPAVPFALVDEEWVDWLGLEPAPSHPAATLFEELSQRKLLVEPFERIGRALAEVHEPGGR